MKYLNLVPGKMKKLKVSFLNEHQQTLSAVLELPETVAPSSYVLFAHCFTCNKDIHAVRNISKSLTQNGLGVFTFDFTGLGQSEGEFGATNFSSNIKDLLCAADYMRTHYQAPEIIIGHSLGGAAAIFAAQQIEESKALVTIGTPADPAHIVHLIASKREEIASNGKAIVTIAGRDFEIQKHFLEDIESHYLSQVLHQLKKAYLIVHAPEDKVVGIENAALLYQAARHPKSFLSLDGADHLLSKKSDSAFVGNMIALWASRYIESLHLAEPALK